MPRIARLVVMSGPRAGEHHEIRGKLTVGRRPENGASFRDDQMSRFHALIEKRGEGWVLEDLSGKGRTRIDGQPVDGSLHLDDQARITLGRTIFRFRVEEVEPAEGRTVSALSPYSPLSVDGGTTPLPEFESAQGSSVRLVPMDYGPAREVREAVDQKSYAKAAAHLNLLLEANAIISTELDLAKLFERILDVLFNAFPAHRAAVMTKLPDSDELALRALRVEEEDDGREDPQISSSIAYRAFRERVGVLILDAGLDERFDARRSIIDQDIRSAICAPMVHQDDALGVIYLDTRGVARAFSEPDLVLLHGIAAAAAGSVKNATLVASLKETAADTIYRLALAAEQRDGETGFHIQRMADYSASLAHAMGRPADWCDTLRLAAPMHDVGKIGIPDAILKKPDKLTEDEWAIMRQHTTKGGEILAGAKTTLLKMAHEIALTHHEKYDGSGYPNGLKADEIPLSGRIVAVADVFDAVMSRRVYKPAFALDKSLDILHQGKGRHFDPAVVDAFMSIQDEILGIRDRYEALEASSLERNVS